MINIPSVLKIIVALFFLATFPAQVYALTPGQVFDKVKNAVVVVKTLNLNEQQRMHLWIIETRKPRSLKPTAHGWIMGVVDYWSRLTKDES